MSQFSIFRRAPVLRYHSPKSEKITVWTGINQRILVNVAMYFEVDKCEIYIYIYIYIYYISCKTLT